MILTNEILEKGKSSSGGWSKEQLDVLGVAWPPKNGWKQVLVNDGVEVSDDKLAIFLYLKDRHIKSKVLKKSIAGPAKVRGTRPEPCKVKGKWAKGIRKELLTKKNPSEKRVERLLGSAGCVFFRERPIRIKRYTFFIDFLVTSIRMPRKKVRIAVEVDGAYHFTPEQQWKDREREELLLRTCRVNGILRIPVAMVKEMTSEQLIAHIRSVPHNKVVCLGDGYSREL